jgi:membrane fusion protein, multidrug efflux system
MGKKTTRWITISILAVILIGLLAQRLGWLDAQANGSEDAASSQRQSPAALPVNIKVLRTERILDMLTLSGSLEADETVDLSSEIAGKVQQIHFREGSYVKQGQMMVKLNDDELQAELDRTTYQRKLAEQQEKRRKQLLEKGGLSQEEYDQALTELNTLQAEIDLLKVRIAKTSIRAPFSGEVGFRYVSEGSYLSPGTRVAQLVKTQPIKISFTVPERYSLKMKPGLPVTFGVEGLDDTLQAKVYAKAPNIDPETRTLEVKAQAANPGGRLSPGAFATLTVQLEEYPDAIMIPNRAVMPELNRQLVYQYRAGTAIATEIKTGLRRADRVQVVAGLEPGDTIITSGLIQMREGMSVQISDEGGSRQ